MWVDEEIVMPGGYRLQINWSVYPEARIVDSWNGQKIAQKSWIMTGRFFIYGRIERWAIRSVNRHEKFVRRLTTRKSKFPVAVGRSYEEQL